MQTKTSVSDLPNWKQFGPGLLTPSRLEHLYIGYFGKSLQPFCVASKIFVFLQIFYETNPIPFDQQAGIK
jgi:hypothetical protein